MRPDPSPCAAVASAQGAELPWSSGSNPSGRCRSHSWDGHLKHFLRKMMGNAKGIKNGLCSCLFQCYVLKFQFDFMGLTGNRMSSIGLSPNLRIQWWFVPKSPGDWEIMGIFGDWPWDNDGMENLKFGVLEVLGSCLNTWLYTNSTQFNPSIIVVTFFGVLSAANFSYSPIPMFGGSVQFGLSWPPDWL